MSILTIIVFVGITGGADTTRLPFELAAALAIDGRDVAVLDVAFVTQSLSDYVSGTLDPDATALVTDAADVPLESGLAAFEADAGGRVAVCPATAPSKRLVRAMTPDAARTLEGRIAETADGFGHVLADASLLVPNQTVAATVAYDRVTLVALATDRDVDAVGRLNVRVAGTDTDIDAVVSTSGALDGAGAVVPGTEAIGPADALTRREDAELVAGVAAVAEVLLDIEIDIVAATNGALSSVSEYVRR